MDFFEAQHNARRKTWQLGLLFGLAVLVLVILTNVLVAAVYMITIGGVAAGSDIVYLLGSVPVDIWLWASLSVVTVVILASIYKYLMIRGGGRAIAESLGGQRVQSNTTDFKERRLLNVVEEMAIAAGVSVPPVYLLQEPGINAFAAGYTPDDAVIGITAGALNFLNREELQGVIAHEFSHILNGDTRINIRLIAILFGILFIGLVGNMLLRGSRHGLGRASSSREGGGGVAAIVILGAGLAVLGYAGTFFGNLIKAAVSRQREYLADAAAVQYTRNPTGISVALQKIGGAGSRLQNNGANEISHMFFGQAISHFLGNMMATHPPLPKRISAIDPTWNGEFPINLQPSAVDGSIQGRAIAAGASGFSGSLTATTATATQVSMPVIEGTAVDVETLREIVGRPDDRSYRTADAIIDTTQQTCLDAARDPCAAHLLIYALLLHKKEHKTGAANAATASSNSTTGANAATPAEVQANTLSDLRPGELQAIAELHTTLDNTDDLHRLALLELAVPALKQMSHPQYKSFVARVIKLIKADKHIELFEWVLHRLLLKELTPHFEKPRSPKIRHRKVERVANSAATLIAVLAHYGHDNQTTCEAAYQAGMTELELDTIPAQPQIDLTDNFTALNKALAELRDLTPLQKPRVLKACARSVLFDQKINAEEGALLQGISAALDCPLPPSVVAKPAIGQ